MGKKKKIKNNNWNLSPEQQENFAEELYRKEVNGITQEKEGDTEIPILSDINNFIRKGAVTNVTLNKKEETPTTHLNKEILTIHDFDKEIVKEFKPTTEVNEQPAIDESNYRKITWVTKGLSDIYRIVLNDGVSPTSFSLEAGLQQDLLDMEIDDDTTCEYWSKLLTYIISLKHPTAMFKKDEINKGNEFDFSNVISFDSDKFMFVDTENYLLAYRLDEQSFDDLEKLFEVCEYDNRELLKIGVSLAYVCSAIMQAFFIEDEWYLAEFYESLFNQKELFYRDFSTDAKTATDYELKEEFEEFTYFDAKELHISVRGLIEELTGTSYFDDDDEDDDEDYDDDEESDNQDEVEYEVTETTTHVNKVSVEEAERNVLSLEQEVVSYANKQAEAAKQLELAAQEVNEETHISTDLLSDEMKLLLPPEDLEPSNETTATVTDKEETTNSKPTIVTNKDDDDDLTVQVVRKGKA